MSVPTLKEHIRQELVGNTEMFLVDLAAMSEEALRSKPGGVARSPFDFIYEVAFVNRRFTKRLRSEDPGPFPEPWMTAPEEFQTKEGAIAAVKESMEGLVAEWDKLSESDLSRKIPTPMGETTPLELCVTAAKHVHYHDGQLNYIQAMSGDAAMHWQE